MKWGMVIDLQKCTGCGECVAACKMENNVAIVDSKESAMGRTMLWMDMLTFYEGESPTLRARLFPRPCMHCDHPPCTKVCPVHATYINEEGIVAQIYPQCIGCRYCMAACPYTVKSFNWYKPEWAPGIRRTKNPDVSVREVGVVEKCTFCVHRLQGAKENAKAEQRDLAEADYQPACAESCPTGAIVFGDLSNRAHQVSRLTRSPRAFRLMEDLGTEPKVVYLKEVD
jgi:molybdopterin-containing oxidoreductase family iron-sulfur binding subunit